MCVYVRQLEATNTFEKIPKIQIFSPQDQFSASGHVYNIEGNTGERRKMVYIISAVPKLF